MMTDDLHVISHAMEVKYNKHIKKDAVISMKIHDVTTLYTEV